MNLVMNIIVWHTVPFLYSLWQFLAIIVSEMGASIFLILETVPVLLSVSFFIHGVMVLVF